MARSYKRDSSGRFAGGGGGGGSRKGGGGKKGKSKAGVAERKAAVVRQVSSNALAGRRNTSTARSYVRAQQGEKMRLSGGGKGNKAAKRAAGVQAKAAQVNRAKQFSSKSAKNTAARAAYKEAASKYRSTEKMAAGARKNNPSHAAFWNRKAGGAKSGLTRVTNRLTGKTKSRKRSR